MALRTKILGIRKKSFNHTREAIQWAEKIFTGDSENAEELARFRLMARDIRTYEGSTATITVTFDTDGAIQNFEVFGRIPWRAWAVA
ncbi:MAG: hypothetical protein U1F76_18005 [Candidatus Competibacteraceae bacterium]